MSFFLYLLENILTIHKRKRLTGLSLRKFGNGGNVLAWPSFNDELDITILILLKKLSEFILPFCFKLQPEFWLTKGYVRS